MKQITLLRIAGIISILFTFLHFTFPFMPGWDISLNAMTKEIRSIFITYHYVLIAFVAGMGFISTFQSKKLIDSPIKNSIVILFSSIYVIRIITEFTCWGISFPQAAIVLPMCLLPLLCYIGVTFSSSAN